MKAKNIFITVIAVAIAAIGIWLSVNAQRNADIYGELLHEIERETIILDTPKADISITNYPVYVQGELQGTTLVDSRFMLQYEALRLKREVWMYQFREVEEEEYVPNSDGSDTKVMRTRYRKVWAKEHIDASRFRNPNYHHNPPMPYASRIFDANVTLEELRFDATLTKLLHSWQHIDAQNARTKELRYFRGDLYSGDPNAPRIGDVKIRYYIVASGYYSLIARLNDATLYPFIKGDEPFALIGVGEQSFDTLLAKAKQKRTASLWGYRAVTFGMLSLAIIFALHAFALYSMATRIKIALFAALAIEAVIAALF